MARDGVEALEAGADTFVRKLYDAAYLLSRVDAACAARAATGSKLRMSADLLLLGRCFPVPAEKQQVPLGECRFGLTLASVQKERQGLAAPADVRGPGA